MHLQPNLSIRPKTREAKAVVVEATGCSPAVQWDLHMLNHCQQQQHRQWRRCHFRYVMKPSERHFKTVLNCTDELPPSSASFVCIFSCSDNADVHSTTAYADGIIFAYGNPQVRQFNLDLLMGLATAASPLPPKDASLQEKAAALDSILGL